MIVKIVCAGSNHFSKLYSPNENEFLIGVDGGAKTIIKMKLPLHLAIGDFDSSNIFDIKKHCQNIITYPSHKDKSDLELALIYLQSLDWNIEKIIIYNATGKRLDHYQSALNLLVNYSHLPLNIIDNKNLIYLITTQTVVVKDKYKYISFFATTPDTIITLNGFIYDLDNYQLKMYDNLCLSNEIKGKIGKVDINNKKVIVFQSN